MVLCVALGWASGLPRADALNSEQTFSGAAARSSQNAHRIEVPRVDERPHLAVGRASLDVGAESAVGLLFTHGDPLSEGAVSALKQAANSKRHRTQAQSLLGQVQKPKSIATAQE